MKARGRRQMSPQSPLDSPYLKKAFLRLPKVYQQYGTEMRSASELMERGSKNYALIWWHLERAHILSQASAWRHFGVHLSMLGLAIVSKNFREIIGQIPRLLLSTPSSFLGFAPLGNTGRSNVSMFKPMRLPRDFENLIRNTTS